jgi:hypothetical protein
LYTSVGSSTFVGSLAGVFLFWVLIPLLAVIIFYCALWGVSKQPRAVSQVL